MNRTTTRLLKSEYTSERLQNKLSICGSHTISGYRIWCRSPGCDCCRRYRARYVADAVADWTDTITTTHRIQRIEISTEAAATPDRVLNEINGVRRTMRRAYHYRQRHDARWEHVEHYGCWSLEWDGATWAGTMRGIVYHGPVSEIRYLDEVGGAVGARLIPFPPSVIRLDVRDYMYRAFAGVAGLISCNPLDLSMAYNAIDYRGGFKSLVSRRGMQGDVR